MGQRLRLPAHRRGLDAHVSACRSDAGAGGEAGDRRISGAISLAGGSAADAARQVDAALSRRADTRRRRRRWRTERARRPVAVGLEKRTTARRGCRWWRSRPGGQRRRPGRRWRRQRRGWLRWSGRCCRPARRRWPAGFGGCRWGRWPRRRRHSRRRRRWRQRKWPFWCRRPGPGWWRCVRRWRSVQQHIEVWRRGWGGCVR